MRIAVIAKAISLKKYLIVLHLRATKKNNVEIKLSEPEPEEEKTEEPEPAIAEDKEEASATTEKKATKKSRLRMAFDLGYFSNKGTQDGSPAPGEYMSIL